MRLLCCCMCIS